MKPICLKMKAFGSYQEETIDFSHVNHGVFLVTGDTGAGKTTIFDAITYALYGECSGGRRDGEMMVSQYAEKGEETEVEFTFAYGKDVYTVRRFPRQKKYRKKKKEDGTEILEELKTLKESEAELIFADGEIFSGKKKEVDDKIKEILGVDAAQFTQIAMLAQGEFLKLLLAKSDDRKKIFSKIFDTCLYYQVEKELENRYKYIYGELEDNRKEIETRLSDIVCKEGSRYFEDWQEKGSFSDDRREETVSLIEGILGELNAAYDGKREEISGKEIKREQVQRKLTEAQGINRDFKELDNARGEKKRLEERTAEMEGINGRLKLAGKARKVDGVYALYMDKSRSLSDKTDLVESLKVQLVGSGKELQRVTEECAQAVERYEAEFPAINEKRIALAGKLSAYDELEKVKSSLALKRMELAKGEKQQKTKAQSLKKQQEEQKALKQEIDSLRKKAEGEGEVLKQSSSLEQLLESQRVCLACMKKEQDYVSTLTQYQASLSKAEGEWKTADEHYQQLYNDFLKGQIPALRAKLLPGEPCPVCGSVHHSRIETEKVILVRQEEVEQAKEAAVNTERAKAEWEKKIQDIKGRREENQKQINEYRERIDDRQIEGSLPGKMAEKGEMDISHLEQTIQRGEQEAARLRELERSIAEAKNALADREKRQEKAGTEVLNLHESLKELEIELAKLRAETEGQGREAEKLAGQLPYPDREEAEGQIENYRVQSEKLDAEKKAAEKKREEQSDLQKKLVARIETESASMQSLMEEEQNAKKQLYAVLVKQGFASVKEYLKACMPEEEEELLREDLEAYRQSLQDVAIRIAQLKERTSGKEPVDEAGLKEQLECLKRELAHLQQEEKQIYADKQKNEDARDAIVRCYQEREKLDGQYGLYKRLYDTAKGNLKGKKGIDFQTYVQRRYFKEVIRAANVRLVRMSGNQFILQCRELERLDNRGNVGLDLDVYSIVNADTRDVKSLSGGESFMAALSMALGLSDLIQSRAGRVKMDTMFIDEGFGSLSEDTRNQALSMLNELSEGNRLIGIISHVSELKAQVETKLVVKKTDRGSRAEWV